MTNRVFCVTNRVFFIKKWTDLSHLIDVSHLFHCSFCLSSVTSMMIVIGYHFMIVRACDVISFIMQAVYSQETYHIGHMILVLCMVNVAVCIYAYFILLFHSIPEYDEEEGKRREYKQLKHDIVPHHRPPTLLCFFISLRKYA